MATYFQKLKDPKWQRKRLEALEAADWTCEVCCDTGSTLHVHHKQYIKCREPWEYENNQLAVLCEACHKEAHRTDDRLIAVVSTLPIEGMRWIDRRKAACLLAGVMGLDDFELRDSTERAWFQAGFDVQARVDELMPSLSELRARAEQKAN